MSLTTMLLAFLAPIVRPKSPGLQWAREKALEAERDALREELEHALRRNETLVLERDSALRRLDLAHQMLAAFGAERIDRRMQHAQQDLLVQYARMNPLPAQQHNDALAAQQYQQGLANSHAQYNAQQAMNAQNAWPYCNCVPARHDMLLGSIGGV